MCVFLVFFPIEIDMHVSYLCPQKPKYESNLL